MELIIIGMISSIAIYRVSYLASVADIRLICLATLSMPSFAIGFIIGQGILELL